MSWQEGTDYSAQPLWGKAGRAIGEYKDYYIFLTSYFGLNSGGDAGRRRAHV
jgi:hypothetical protein